MFGSVKGEEDWVRQVSKHPYSPSLSFDARAD